MTETTPASRVLFWSATLFPNIGGIEILAERFLPAMRRRGYELLVVAPHSDDAPQRESLDGGTTVLRLPFYEALDVRDAAQIVSLRRRVAELKRRFRPQLVHVNGLHPAIWFHLETSSRPDPPQLVTLHAWKELPSGRGTTFGKLLRGASWVTCCARATLESARATFPEITATSSLVYNGVVAGRDEPAALPFAPPRILLLGRLEHEKGFDLALAALARLIPHNPDFRVTVAGDGPARSSLLSDARALGISDRTEFIGWVPNEQVPLLIDTATVVVVPSRFEEGSNLVALEAALRARPVVATRFGALPELVKDGESGFVVEPEDPAALAAAVESLLSDPARAVRMGSAGRERTRATFGWQAYVDAYDDLYGKLIGESQDAA